MLSINKNLNLVCPIDTDNGTIYIHSAPIGKSAFDEYFLILSKTMDSLHSEGLSRISGPRIAALMLKKIAKEDGIWETEGSRIGIKDGLMNEIRRLSNVVLATAEGWKTIPVADAVRSGHISDDDLEEAEGYIVFFTCVSHLHKKKEIPSFLKYMETLWDTQSTSLNCTEYADSLLTSTEIETFVPTVSASSIPG